MRLVILTLSLVFAATACTTSQSDYDHLLSESLTFVEKSGPVRTIVLPPNLSEAASRSARSLRPVIEQADLPPSPQRLPTSHFTLKSISINGGKAHVNGTLGPVQDYPPLCGTDYDFAYTRIGWRWRPGDIQTVVC